MTLLLNQPIVATPRLTLIGTRANPVVAGPRTRSPSPSNSELCAGHIHPVSVLVTVIPWCGHRKLNAVYLFVPTRAIPTGTPLMEPIRIAPPTADSAGKSFNLTESLPPGSFFTTALAAAGTSLPPNATTAHTPAKCCHLMELNHQTNLELRDLIFQDKTREALKKIQHHFYPTN